MVRFTSNNLFLKISLYEEALLKVAQKLDKVALRLSYKYETVSYLKPNKKWLSLNMRRTIKVRTISFTAQEGEAINKFEPKANKIFTKILRSSVYN